MRKVISALVVVLALGTLRPVTLAAWGFSGPPGRSADVSEVRRPLAGLDVVRKLSTVKSARERTPAEG